MRRGFTMIELIFVIVIIGILAAVAIPKLAATRDDARISNLIANARTSLGDMKSYYTSQGATRWADQAVSLAGVVTDVPLGTDCTAATPNTAITGGPFVLCDETGGTACITFDVNATDITITSAGGTPVCDGVAADPAVQGLVGGTAGSSKIHKLGGVSVTR